MILENKKNILLRNPLSFRFGNLFIKNKNFYFIGLVFLIFICIYWYYFFHIDSSIQFTIFFVFTCVIIGIFLFNPQYIFNFLLIAAIIQGNLIVNRLIPFELHLIGNIDFVAEDFLFIGFLLLYIGNRLIKNRQNKEKIDKGTKITLFYTLLIFGYFILSYFQGNIARAGAEIRSSLIYYSIVFLSSGFLEDKKSISSALKGLFLGIMIYCFLYFSLFWKGNPLHNFVSLYNSEIKKGLRIGYASKSVFILFPFLLSFAIIRIKNISIWAYFVFPMALLKFGLSQSRACWIVLSLGSLCQLLLIFKTNKWSLKIMLRSYMISILLLVFIVFSAYLISIYSPVTQKIIREKITSIFMIHKLKYMHVRELGSLETRLTNYDLIWQRIIKKPIWGHGLGAEVDIFSIDGSYLMIFYRFGIVGLILFLTMIVFYLSKIYHYYKNARSPFEVCLTISILFSLINTIILALQDNIFFKGRQIIVIAILFVFINNINKIFHSPKH